MTTAQEQVAQDIATIKSGIAAWGAAAAAAQTKALADAKAAWDADNEAAWNKAHSDLSGVISAMGAGQPITPPATADNPNPTPVELPTAAPSPAAGAADPAA